LWIVSDVTLIEPIDEADEALDARIVALRSEGLSLPAIARRLMISPHALHRRLDAILPTVDAAYRRRAIAESLVQVDQIISTHMKAIADPESCSIIIRAICEKRSLLGVTGSVDPVMLSVNSRSEKSTEVYKRAIAHVLGRRSPKLVEDLDRLAAEHQGGTSGSEDTDKEQKPTV
jgi:hypothetical protein